MGKSNKPINDPASGVELPPYKYEFDLAARLLYLNAISQIEYETAKKELQHRIAFENHDGPISILYVLNQLALSEIPKVMLAIAKDTGFPLLPLASFNPQEEAYSKLPPIYLTHRGALPFDLADDHLLVAILNPMDSDLIDDIKREADCPCVFYLASPADYDKVLQQIGQL